MFVTAPAFDQGGISVIGCERSMEPSIFNVPWEFSLFHDEKGFAEGHRYTLKRKNKTKKGPYGKPKVIGGIGRRVIPVN